MIAAVMEDVEDFDGNGGENDNTVIEMQWIMMMMII